MDWLVAQTVVPQADWTIVTVLISAVVALGAVTAFLYKSEASRIDKFDKHLNERLERIEAKLVQCETDRDSLWKRVAEMSIKLGEVR